MAKRRILLVDDEVDFARLLKMNLEATGRYEVCLESRGAEGLDAAKAFRPDLIFLDVVMPDLDGDRVAAQIRGEPALKETPIVFLTAIVSRQEAHNHEGRIGGYPFLAKPVTVKDVTTCIEANVQPGCNEEGTVPWLRRRENAS